MAAQVKLEEPDDLTECKTSESTLSMKNESPSISQESQESSALLNNKSTKDFLRANLKPNWRKRKSPLLSSEEVAMIQRLAEDPPVNPKEIDTTNEKNQAEPSPARPLSPLQPVPEAHPPSIAAENPYYVTLTRLFKNFLSEAGLSSSIFELHSFKELFLHLNPLLEFSSLRVKTTPVPSEQSEGVVESFESPENNQNDPVCIVCKNLAPTVPTSSLRINEAIQILIAGISCGTIRIEKAREVVLNRSLIMCKHHTAYCYELMSKATGAVTELDVDKIPDEIYSPLFENYKHLMGIRNALHNRPPKEMPIYSLRDRIKMFFQAHTPKSIFLNEERRIANERLKNIRRMVQMEPNEKLRGFLDSAKLNLDPEEEKELMFAIAHTDKRHNSDLVHKSIEERRAHAREQRYANYPEEFRTLMKPFDDAYEKQAARNRSEMITIRQNKHVQPLNLQVSRRMKRQRAAPTDFARLAQSVLNCTKSDPVTTNTSTNQMHRMIIDGPPIEQNIKPFVSEHPVIQMNDNSNADSSERVLHGEELGSMISSATSTSRSHFPARIHYDPPLEQNMAPFVPNRPVAQINDNSNAGSSERVLHGKELDSMTLSATLTSRSHFPARIHYDPPLEQNMAPFVPNRPVAQMNDNSNAGSSVRPIALSSQNSGTNKKYRLRTVPKVAPVGRSPIASNMVRRLIVRQRAAESTSIMQVSQPVSMNAKVAEEMSLVSQPFNKSQLETPDEQKEEKKPVLN